MSRLGFAVSKSLEVELNVCLVHQVAPRASTFHSGTIPILMSHFVYPGMEGCESSILRLRKQWAAEKLSIGGNLYNEARPCMAR